jgi:hypothetical protein
MADIFNFDMGGVDFGGGADIDGFLSAKSEGESIYASNTILQNILPNAPLAEFELGGANGVQTQGAPGIDALFSQQPEFVQASTARRRQMVASCADLRGFTRMSAETLVHKSNHDLWALKKEADGKFYIERLFDDNGEPLKG